MNLKIETGDKQAKNYHINHIFFRTLYIWALKIKISDKQAKSCYTNHIFCRTLYLWTWKLKKVINKLQIVTQITFFVGLCTYNLKIETGDKQTHFWPIFPFYTPWKHQKTKGFLVFSGVLKWEHWPEIG